MNEISTATTPELFRFVDYREVLRFELERRKGRNRRYSLRAFAKDLAFNAATLSEVLNRKKGLSEAMAQQIATRLGFSPEQQSFYRDLVLKEHARSKADRRRAEKRLEQYHPRISYTDVTINTAIGRLYDNWHTLALLEWIDIERMQFAPEVAASRLKVSPDYVNQLLKDMEVSGILRVENGEFSRSDKYLSYRGDVPNQSLRQFHREILSQAAHAIESQPIHSRKAISAVMSVSAKRIVEARVYLDKVREDFFKEFADDKDADSVYAFAIHFFNTTSSGADV